MFLQINVFNMEQILINLIIGGIILKKFEDIINERQEFFSSLITVVEILEDSSNMEEILFEDERKYLDKIFDDGKMLQNLGYFSWDKINGINSFINERQKEI